MVAQVVFHHYGPSRNVYTDKNYDNKIESATGYSIEWCKSYCYLHIQDEQHSLVPSQALTADSLSPVHIQDHQCTERETKTIVLWGVGTNAMTDSFKLQYLKISFTMEA